MRRRYAFTRARLVEAEDQRLEIVGPLRRAIRGDAHVGRERVVGREVIYLLRCLAGETAPGQHRIARVVERAVHPAPHRGEVVGLRAPRESRILIRRRVERANRAAARIEQLHAVSRASVDVDRHGEKGAVVVPGELGHVAERELGAAVEIAHDDVSGPAALRRIAAQRDVRAVVAQRE